MSELITDQKEVYKIIKFFKDIYSDLNKGKDILFENSYNTKQLSFTYINSNNSIPIFYLLSGSLEDDNSFISWLNSFKDKVFITMQFSDFRSISKCLKKNVISYESTETTFIIKYNEKDVTESKEIIFEIQNKEIPEVSLIKKIDNLLFNSKIFTFSEKEFNKFGNEIVEIYNNENKLSAEGNLEEKLLEVSKNELLSSMKNGSYCISFTNKLSAINADRYIKIECYKDELKLKLDQFFHII